MNPLMELGVALRRLATSKWCPPLGPDIYDIFPMTPVPKSPCAIRAAVDRMVAEGKESPFVIHMVCHCPKCSPRCQ
jgi:hypothetical protein